MEWLHLNTYQVNKYLDPKFDKVFNSVDVRHTGKVHKSDMYSMIADLFWFIYLSLLYSYLLIY